MATMFALPPVAAVALISPVREVGRWRVAPARFEAPIEAIDVVDAEFVMVDDAPLQLPAPSTGGGSRRALAAYAPARDSSRLVAIA